MSCDVDRELGERRRRVDSEDLRLSVAGPPICVYHRDDGGHVGPGPYWAARVVEGEGVRLYRPGARRVDRHRFGAGVRLARLDIPRSDPSAGTWAVFDASWRLVALVVGVPPGQPWQDDPQVVLSGARAFGP